MSENEVGLFDWIANRLNLLDLIKLVLSIRYNLIRRSARSKRPVSFIRSRTVSCVDRDRVGRERAALRDLCKFNLARLCSGEGPVRVGLKTL